MAPFTFDIYAPGRNAILIFKKILCYNMDHLASYEKYVEKQSSCQSLQNIRSKQAFT